MAEKNWLHRGYVLPSGNKIGKRLSAGLQWQLYATSGKGYCLVALDALISKWLAVSCVPVDMFAPISVDNCHYHLYENSSDSLISSVEHGPFPETSVEAEAFAIALREARKVHRDVSLSDALYIEKFSLLFPTFTQADDCRDEVILGRWLSQGVDISTDNFSRLCELMTWMPPDEVSHIIELAGFKPPRGDVISKVKTQAETQQKEDVSQHRSLHSLLHSGEMFKLTGRPELEQFFNEHVVDIVLNAEKYERMGIEFPGAIILHGPPGCGKTFAVDQLIDFLGWPSYNIESGSIGSPYIHDTSKKIAEVFDLAQKNAPAIIVIDEMEAFLTGRDPAASNLHHMEEIAEFLRKIPAATKNKVLVIGMTNLIDTIDPAILRRGRFDHIIEVKMPTQEEVASLLKELLRKLPIDETVEYDGLAKKLAQHPLSDVTFVVREAGRLAVKKKMDRISNDLLLDAYKALPKAKGEKRAIGFSADIDE